MQSDEARTLQTLAGRHVPLLASTAPNANDSTFYNGKTGACSTCKEVELFQVFSEKFNILPVTIFGLASVKEDIIATRGVDTNAVLFDRKSGHVSCTLSGHPKKVLFHTEYPSINIFLVW